MRFFVKWRNRRRQIFRYWDGQRTKSIDPIFALSQLQSHPQYNQRTHPDLIDEGDEDATRIAAQAVCDVFEVAPFQPETERGLTIAERLALLMEFYTFLDTLKKSTSDSPTSSEPMAETSDDSNEPITSDTSVSS